MILLTGITGKVGDATARSIAARGASARAIVRDAEKAAPLAQLGIELIVGDLGDGDTVRQAMEGVDKALIILPNSHDQEAMEKQFTDLAVAAGVKHLVKLSSMESVAEATAPIPRVHWAVEEYIRAADIASTMVKPNFFMQNLLTSAATIKSMDKFFLPMGNAVTAMGDTRDVGDFVGEVLTGVGHEGRSYEITGPELLTFSDVAEQFSEVLGRRIEYVDQDPESFRETLSQFITEEWHLNAVCDEFALLASGGREYTTETFSEVMGREPIALRQFIEDFRGVFEEQ